MSSNPIFAFDPHYFQYPYTALNRLQQQHEPVFITDHALWLITDYRTVKALLDTMTLAPPITPEKQENRAVTIREQVQTQLELFQNIEHAEFMHTFAIPLAEQLFIEETSPNSYQIFLHLLGNGLLTLLQHPKQHALLQNQRALLPKSIEEMLRYESPLQILHHDLKNDLLIAGRALVQGSKIGLSIGAANRDPNIFTNADLFMPSRHDQQHLTLHPAIVAPSTAQRIRLCAYIVFDQILERLPYLRLRTSDPKKIAYQHSWQYRALDTLHLKIKPHLHY